MFLEINIFTKQTKFRKEVMITFESSILFSKWAKPRIFGSGKLHSKIREISKLQYQKRGPTRIAYNPLIGMWLASKFDKRNKPTHLTYKRQLLTLDDDGVIAVDEMTDKTTVPNPNLPNILYLPGGGLHSHSARTKISANWFLQAGYPSVFVANRRGTSNVPLYSPRISLCVGEFNDTEQVVEHLIKSVPDKRWIITGSSFGASCALDYFSKIGADHREVIGGVFDSVAFNGKRWLDVLRNDKSLTVQLMIAINLQRWLSEALDHPANNEVRDEMRRLIDKEKFVKSLITRKRSELLDLVYGELLSKLCQGSSLSLKTPKDFHIHAYPYFTDTTRTFMNIKKPIVMVNSQDDVMCRIDHKDAKVLEENSNLCLWLYAGGAHMQFTESHFPYRPFIREVYLENVDLLSKMQL